MKKKKILAVTLTCAMIAQNSVGVFAYVDSVADGVSEKEVISAEVKKEYASDIEEGFVEGDYRYEVREGNAYITEYLGEEKNLVIPSQINGYKVVGIESYAMYGDERINTLVISEGIEYIGDEAFYSCSQLKDIRLPNSLREIGNGTFSYCDKLETVIIPEGVTKIGQAAFYWCRALGYVELPSTIEYIGQASDGISGTFGMCKNLTKVKFKEGKKDASIGTSAFADTGLISVTIPGNYKVIGKDAFNECESLERFELKPSISGVNDQVILWAAVWPAKNLKSAIIPSTVENMEYYALGESENLVVYGEKESVVESYTQQYSTTFAEFKTDTTNDGYTYSIENEEAVILKYDGDAVDITIPDKLGGYPVTTIAEEAFYGNNKISSLVIPTGIDKIYSSAFANCSELSILNLQEGTNLTRIESGAFMNCDKLTGSITIPSNYDIGNFSFYDCDGLTEVIFETSKDNREQNIGAFAFCECDSLIKVTFPSNLKNIGNYAFGHCSYLENVKFPEGLINIEEGAFTECNTFTSITLPSTMEFWNNALRAAGAFEGCKNLTEVKLLEGKKEACIAQNAFKNTPIKSIVIPQNYVCIFQRAFEDCYELERVEIIEDEKTYSNGSIEWGAFRNCKALKTIIIPSRITYIGDNVFLDTNSLVIYGKIGSEAEGYAKWSEPQIEFVEYNGDFAATSTASRSNVTLGENVTINVTATGGAAPYTYSYIVYNKTTDSWFRFADNITSDTYTWTAGSEGERYFYVDVKDRTGEIVRCNALKVTTGVDEDKELAVSVKTSASYTKAGDKVTFTASAVGGKGEYTYSYIVYNDTTKSWFRLADNITSSTYTWTAGSDGVRYFFVDVKDATGKVVRCSDAVKVVTGEQEELDVVGSVSSANITVGDTISIKGTAAGGTAPYTYSFVVNNKATGGWFRYDFSSSDTLSWTATSAGERVFYVEAKDATGNVVRANGVSVVVE